MSAEYAQWLSSTDLVIGPCTVREKNDGTWHGFFTSAVNGSFFFGTWAQAVAWAVLHTRLRLNQSTTPDDVLAIQKVLDKTWPDGEAHDDDHFTWISAGNDLAAAMGIAR